MKAGWFVDLIGEPFDLQELERLRFPAGTELEIHEDKRFIRMITFSPTADASEVLAAAAEAIRVINGAGQLYIANWRNIRGGGPMQVDTDGKRHLFVFAEPLVVRTRFWHTHRFHQREACWNAGAYGVRASRDHGR